MLLAASAHGPPLADAAPGREPGPAGVRPGAAPRPLARLRHGLEGRDGGADHLLPGHRRLPRRAAAHRARLARARPDHGRPAAGRSCARSACRRPCRRWPRACGSPPPWRRSGPSIGEWVGSSAGLGYLMLHANARMQVDLMFAALLVLAGDGAGPVAGRRPRRPRRWSAGSPRTLDHEPARTDPDAARPRPAPRCSPCAWRACRPRPPTSSP